MSDIDLSGAAMWAGVIFLGMLAFNHWQRQPNTNVFARFSMWVSGKIANRPSLNWETSVEEAEEAARFCSHQNRRNRSHLSLVSGGAHGNSDYEAFRRSASR